MEDPFDEEILCHLGVGDERIQRKMQPTEENLLRVEAKRKWVRCPLPLPFPHSLSIWGGWSEMLMGIMIVGRRKRTQKSPHSIDVR